MKALVWVFILFTTISTARAERVNLIVPRTTLDLYTEDNLVLMDLHIGMECRVYSKARFFGTPVSIEREKSEPLTHFSKIGGSPGHYQVANYFDLDLSFRYSSLFKYIHLCKFVALVKVVKGHKWYKTQSIDLGVFQPDGEFDVTEILRGFLNDKKIAINKYVDEPRFVKR